MPPKEVDPYGFPQPRILLIVTPNSNTRGSLAQAPYSHESHGPKVQAQRKAHLDTGLAARYRPRRSPADTPGGC